VAQKTVVELVDDLDGGDADETVTFALDGVEYQIDLSAANAERLREELATFIGHATRVGGRRQRGSNPVAGTARDKADNQAIREWARSQGEEVADRGRISQDLVMRFQEAHG
jgi:hypothetical protein